MRHYKDEDTMVLILSQNSTPAEEAEYPVPLEQDTSELLDAEGEPSNTALPCEPAFDTIARCIW